MSRGTDALSFNSPTLGTGSDGGGGGSGRGGTTLEDVAKALLSERVGPGVPGWVTKVVVLLVFPHVLILQDDTGALLTKGVGLLGSEADQKVVLSLVFRDVPLEVINGLRGFHAVYVSLALQLLHQHPQLLVA